MTFPDDQTRQKVADASSLPAAVEILRRAAGSHDKLAERLATNRQTVIAWEKGRRFPDDYVEQLRELGVPARLLLVADLPVMDARLREIEAAIVDIRAALSRAFAAPDRAAPPRDEGEDVTEDEVSDLVDRLAGDEPQSPPQEQSA